MLSFDLTFVWTAVNLVVLFLFLRVVLFKRVTAVLDARKARIEAELQQGANAKAEGERNREEYAQLLAGASAERAGILETARKKADALHDEAVANAQAEAARIVAAANEQARQERARAMSQMRDEVASLALAAAGKVLKDNMDTEKNRRLVNDMLNDMEHSGGAA